MRDIGKNIRLLRMQNRLTQDELAEKLFVSRQTVSNYETGRSRPDIDMLVRIAEALDTNVQQLLYGTPGPQVCAAEKRRFAILCIALAAAVLLLAAAEYAHTLLRGKYFLVSFSFPLVLLLRPGIAFLLGSLLSSFSACRNTVPEAPAVKTDP